MLNIGAEALRMASSMSVATSGRQNSPAPQGHGKLGELNQVCDSVLEHTVEVFGVLCECRFWLAGPAAEHGSSAHSCISPRCDFFWVAR